MVPDCPRRRDTYCIAREHDRTGLQKGRSILSANYIHHFEIGRCIRLSGGKEDHSHGRAQAEPKRIIARHRTAHTSSKGVNQRGRGFILIGVL